MLPVVLPEIIAGSWELICCGFSLLAALLSYLAWLR
jgi:hypothetical protein